MSIVPTALPADPCDVSISVLNGRRAAAMPLIAVTTSEMRHNPFDLATPQADPPRREMALGVTYLEAVGRAGALAIAAPPMPGPAIPALLDRVDGILLSGGPDIHPDAYGAAPHPELGPTEPPLDAFELALARAADERDVPILAICRGAQLFNVARGGTLHQHLPDVVGDGVTHRQPGAPPPPLPGRRRRRRPPPPAGRAGGAGPRRHGRGRQPPRRDPRPPPRALELVPPPGRRRPRRAPDRGGAGRGRHRRGLRSGGPQLRRGRTVARRVPGRSGGAGGAVRRARRRVCRARGRRRDAAGGRRLRLTCGAAGRP